MARWAVFRSYLASRDKAALQRIIEAISTDELLSPMNAPLAVQAYRLLGMNDEAELATDRAREAVYDLVLRSWVKPLAPPAYIALHLASEISEPSLVPVEFDRDMAGAVHHEKERFFFLVQAAKLRQNWEECARHAAEGRKHYPTHYDFHGFEGIALGHLGRKAEAIELLKVYLSVSHNDPDVVEARQMLDALEK
jgi:hypothetical protein